MKNNTSHIDNTLVIDALIFENRKAFGYQEYLFNLLDYFFEKRDSFSFNRVIIACPKNQELYFTKYNERFEIIGFNINNKIQHLIMQNLLAKKLKLKKNDTILFTYNYSSIFKSCRHILVVHDLLYLRKKYLPNKMMRWQRYLFIPISLRLADKIIAISNFTKTDILKHYKIHESRICTVYNYFNFKKYSPIEQYFKLSKPYFLSICSTAYHKNTVSVLKAFEQFCKHNSDFDIVFVGGLKDKSSLAYRFYETLSDAIKERIHLLQGISNQELGMLYRNAKGFISLTLFEGLGMPIVEAMYFNLPLILSDLTVCREITEGTRVQFVEPFDINKIEDSMKVIAEKTIITNSCDLVQNRFSKENTSGKYLTILNS